MPKLTIEISKEAHILLKEWAKKERRSLNNYLTLILDEITGVTTIHTTTPYPNSTTQLQNNTNTTTNTITTPSTKKQPKKGIIGGEDDINIIEESEDKYSQWN